MNQNERLDYLVEQFKENSALEKRRMGFEMNEQKRS